MKTQSFPACCNTTAMWGVAPEIWRQFGKRAMKLRLRRSPKDFWGSGKRPMDRALLLGKVVEIGRCRVACKDCPESREAPCPIPNLGNPAKVSCTLVNAPRSSRT